MIHEPELPALTTRLFKCLGNNNYSGVFFDVVKRAGMSVHEVREAMCIYGGRNCSFDNSVGFLFKTMRSTIQAIASLLLASSYSCPTDALYTQFIHSRSRRRGWLFWSDRTGRNVHLNLLGSRYFNLTAEKDGAFYWGWYVYFVLRLEFIRIGFRNPKQFVN